MNTLRERNTNLTPEEKQVVTFVDKSTKELNKKSRLDETSLSLFIKILNGCSYLATTNLVTFANKILTAVNLMKKIKEASCNVATLHRSFEDKIPIMTEHLAAIASASPPSAIFRLKIFNNWMLMLKYTSRETRKSTVLKNVNFMKNILQAVFTTGYYCSQITGLEIFFKYLTSCRNQTNDIIDYITPENFDKTIVQYLKNFDYIHFDMECRKILNHFNMVACGGNIPVYSIVANRGYIGSVPMEKPVDGNLTEELWIDLNAETNTITFYCSSLTFKETEIFWVFIELHFNEIQMDHDKCLMKVILDGENSSCDPQKYCDILKATEHVIFEINPSHVNMNLLTTLQIMNKEAQRKVSGLSGHSNSVPGKTKIANPSSRQNAVERQKTEIEECEQTGKDANFHSPSSSNNSDPNVCTQINMQMSQLNLNNSCQMSGSKSKLQTQKRKSTELDTLRNLAPAKRSPTEKEIQSNSQNSMNLNTSFSQNTVGTQKPLKCGHSKENVEKVKQNGCVKGSSKEKQNKQNPQNYVNEVILPKLYKMRPLYTPCSPKSLSSLDSQVQRRRYLTEQRKKKSGQQLELLDLVSPISKARVELISPANNKENISSKPTVPKIKTEKVKSPVDPIKNGRYTSNDDHIIEEQNKINEEIEDETNIEDDTSTEIFDLIDEEMVIDKSYEQVDKGDGSCRRKLFNNKQRNANKIALHNILHNGIEDEVIDLLDSPISQEDHQTYKTESEKLNDESMTSECGSEATAEIRCNQQRPVEGKKNSTFLNNKKKSHVNGFLKKLENNDSQQDVGSETTDRAWVMKHFFDCLKEKNKPEKQTAPCEVVAEKVVTPQKPVDNAVVHVPESESGQDEEVELIIKKFGQPSLVQDKKAPQFRHLLSEYKHSLDPRFESIINDIKKDSPLDDMNKFLKELDTFLVSYDEHCKAAEKSYTKIIKLWQQISVEKTAYIKMMKLSDDKFSYIFSKMGKVLTSIKNFDLKAKDVYENTINQVNNEGQTLLESMWKNIVGSMANEAHDVIIQHVEDKVFKKD